MSAPAPSGSQQTNQPNQPSSPVTPTPSNPPQTSSRRTREAAPHLTSTNVFGSSAPRPFAGVTTSNPSAGTLFSSRTTQTNTGSTPQSVTTTTAPTPLVHSTARSTTSDPFRPSSPIVNVPDPSQSTSTGTQSAQRSPPPTATSQLQSIPSGPPTSTANPLASSSTSTVHQNQFYSATNRDSYNIPLLDTEIEAYKSEFRLDPWQNQSNFAPHPLHTLERAEPREKMKIRIAIANRHTTWRKN